MQIEISVVENNPKQILVCFQKTFVREVDRSLFQKEVQGKDFSSVKDFQEWFLLLEKKIAKKVALQYLSRRSYPRAILQHKLKAKGVSDAVVHSLLDYLQKKGLIDESYSIEKEVKKWARRGFGPLLIQRKMQQKGYEKNLFLPCIRKILTEDLQKEAIGNLLAKKKQLDKKKLAAWLVRRGYDSFMIRATLF